MPDYLIDMVRLAVEQLRQDYLEAPDQAALLPGSFTLKELRELHEAGSGRPLMRDAFRGQTEPQLTGTGQMSDGARNPAGLSAVR